MKSRYHLDIVLHGSLQMLFQVISLNAMSSILEDALREYNETYATMDLVLFEDAMKHVSPA